MKSKRCKNKYFNDELIHFNKKFVISIKVNLRQNRLLLSPQLFVRYSCSARLFWTRRTGVGEKFLIKKKIIHQEQSHHGGSSHYHISGVGAARPTLAPGRQVRWGRRLGVGEEEFKLFLLQLIFLFLFLKFYEFNLILKYGWIWL